MNVTWPLGSNTTVPLSAWADSSTSVSPSGSLSLASTSTAAAAPARASATSVTVTGGRLLAPSFGSTVTLTAALASPPRPSVIV